MAKGARNRAIRKFAASMTNKNTESAKTYARRLRRMGWKRFDVE